MRIGGSVDSKEEKEDRRGGEPAFFVPSFLIRLPSFKKMVTFALKTLALT